MITRLISLALVALLLTGCATAENIAFMSAQKEAAAAHAVAQVQIAKADADARIAEANALRDILVSGSSDQAKALGAIVYAARGGKTTGVTAPSAAPPITAPAQPASQIYTFASNLLGHRVQLVGLRYGYRQATTLSNNATALGMRQSDNATALGVSTNSTFASIAGYIPQPAANVSTVNTTTTDNSNHSVDSSNRSTASTTDSSTTTNTTTSTAQTLSGSGVIGSGSNAPVTNANPINYSLSGTGTVGSGPYYPVTTTP